MFSHNECPVCGSDSFRRDIENITEVLELGVDNNWVVIDHEETEYDDPKHFVYCSNCFTDVKINKDGSISIVTDEEKEDYYAN